MDQDLLNPAKFRLSTFSIDSRFADAYYAGSADFQIRLPSTVRNVMRVALASVELPKVAYTFSARQGNTQFGVDIGDGTVTLTIADGNYTAAELAAAVQTALQTVDAGFRCEYNAITGRISIWNTDDTLAFNIYLTGGGVSTCSPSITGRRTHWGLGYNLGYRVQSALVEAGTVFTATAFPYTDAAPYYLLQLSCPDQVENTIHSLANGSYAPALAKLVLRGGVYTTQFDDGGNMLRKENTFQQPVAISTLRVRLIDAFGETVEMGDTVWSMTFELMEVVGSCQYTDLRVGYGRC